MGRNLLVLGGFGESKSHLYRIAEVAESIEDIDHYDVMSLPDAEDNPEELKKNVRERLVIADSMGMLNVYAEDLPDEVISFNGPEPLSLAALGRGVRMTMKLHRQQIIDAEHIGTILGHVSEFISHPVNHLRHAPDALAFSSSDRLGEIQQAGIPTKQIRYIDDELFKPEIHKLQKAYELGVMVRLVAGCHHSLALDPTQLHIAYENIAFTDDVEQFNSLYKLEDAASLKTL